MMLSDLIALFRTYELPAHFWIVVTSPVWVVALMIGGSYYLRVIRLILETLFEALLKRPDR